MCKNCKKYFQKLGKYFSSGATSWESSHVASIAGTALSAGRYANGPAYYALFKPQMMTVAMMKMMKKTICHKNQRIYGNFPQFCFSLSSSSSKVKGLGFISIQ